MKKILFPELSYKITGLCFKVHKQLGRFCREKQYADALESILKNNQISYKRECEINNFNPTSPDGNKIDFLIEDKIVLEIKAKKFITKDDYNQMQRYLQSSDKELGLLVNFHSTYLKPKRILNTKLYSDNSDENLDHSDRYEVLEHRADIKIKVFGNNLEELFKNAAGAMVEILKSDTNLRMHSNAANVIEIKVQSVDREVLLVDFLNDILGQSQINKCVYYVSSFKFYNPSLQVELIGYPVERFDEDIKAATYHDLSIRETPKGIWEATILFDV